MSSLNDAFTALKNVMLLHERIDGAQKDMERLTGDLKDTNRWVMDIDRRVSRIEGVMEGYQRASGASQKTLPPE